MILAEATPWSDVVMTVGCTFAVCMVLAVWIWRNS